jgi:hypothetical protein
MYEFAALCELFNELAEGDEITFLVGENALLEE